MERALKMVDTYDHDFLLEETLDERWWEQIENDHDMLEDQAIARALECILWGAYDLHIGR